MKDGLRVDFNVRLIVDSEVGVDVDGRDPGAAIVEGMVDDFGGRGYGG